MEKPKTPTGSGNFKSVLNPAAASYHPTSISSTQRNNGTPSNGPPSRVNSGNVNMHASFDRKGSNTSQNSNHSNKKKSSTTNVPGTLNYNASAHTPQHQRVPNGSSSFNQKNFNASSHNVVVNVVPNRTTNLQNGPGSNKGLGIFKSKMVKSPQGSGSVSTSTIQRQTWADKVNNVGVVSEFPESNIEISMPAARYIGSKRTQTVETSPLDSPHEQSSVAVRRHNGGDTSTSTTQQAQPTSNNSNTTVEVHLNNTVVNSSTLINQQAEAAKEAKRVQLDKQLKGDIVEVALVNSIYAINLAPNDVDDVTDDGATTVPGVTWPDTEEFLNSVKQNTSTEDQPQTQEMEQLTGIEMQVQSRKKAYVLNKQTMLDELQHLVDKPQKRKELNERKETQHRFSQPVIAPSPSANISKSVIKSPEPTPTYNASWNSAISAKKYTLGQALAMMAKSRPRLLLTEEEGSAIQKVVDYDAEPSSQMPNNLIYQVHDHSRGKGNNNNNNMNNEFARAQRSNANNHKNQYGGKSNQYNEHRLAEARRKADEEEADALTEEQLGLGLGGARRREKEEELIKTCAITRMKKLKSTLNKLSVDTFADQMKHLITILNYMKDENEMHAIIDEVCSKSVAYSGPYGELYADMTEVLMYEAPAFMTQKVFEEGENLLALIHQIEMEEKGETNHNKRSMKRTREAKKKAEKAFSAHKAPHVVEFKKVMISVLQAKFESHMEIKIEDLSPENVAIRNTELKNHLKYLGELYNRNVVPLALLNTLIEQYVENRPIHATLDGVSDSVKEEDNVIVTVFCELFEIIGQNITKQSKNKYSEWLQYMTKMKDESATLNTFSKCKIQELIDLKDNNFTRKKILIKSLAPKAMTEFKENTKDYNDDVVHVGKRSDHPYKAYIDSLKDWRSSVRVNAVAERINRYKDGNLDAVRIRELDEIEGIK